jgi:signal transduction histidine kinase
MERSTWQKILPERLGKSLRNRMVLSLLCVVVPMLVGLIAALVLPRQQVEANSSLLVISGGFCALICGFGLFQYIRLTNRIFTTIAWFQKHTRQMAIENENESLNYASEDEFTGLAYSIRAIATQAKRYSREMDEQNQNLERLVIRKTNELRQKNLALAFQNEKVVEATQMKNAFLANISHELRTPLNAILALSDMMKDEVSGKLNDEQRKQSELIYSSGENLLHLINGVLDLSKIEAGRMEVFLEEGPLVKHLIEEGTRLGRLAEAKGLEFNIEVEDEEIVLVQDKDKLRQVFANLMGNAIKFTESGSVTAQIKILTDDKLLYVGVHDTGPGISIEDQQQIFQEFKQLDGDQGAKIKGTGLGLAISRKLINLVGGDIWVDSAEGAGSTFAFVVPLKASARSEDGVDITMFGSLRDPWVKPSNSSGTRHRVLILEPDGIEAGVLKRYLRQRDYLVSIVGSELAALKELRNSHIDLVLMDLTTADLSGNGFLQKMRADTRFSGVPVIINTSHNLMGEDMEQLEALSQAIFRKGSRGVHDLINLVDEILTEDEEDNRMTFAGPVTDERNRVA